MLCHPARLCLFIGKCIAFIFYSNRYFVLSFLFYVMIFVVNVIKPPLPCPNFLNTYKRLYFWINFNTEKSANKKNLLNIFVVVVEWITKMDRTLFTHLTPFKVISSLCNLTSFPKNLIIKKWVALIFYSISLSDNFWLGTLFLKCKIPFIVRLFLTSMFLVIIARGEWGGDSEERGLQELL